MSSTAGRTPVRAALLNAGTRKHHEDSQIQSAVAHRSLYAHTDHHESRSWAQNEPSTQSPQGKVTLASKQLQVDENGSERSAMTTRDFVLDLETGNVALKLVQWKHTSDSKPIRTLVPFEFDSESSSHEKWANELQKEAPQSATRQLANTIYTAYGQEVYWTKHLDRLPKDAHGSFDRERYELVMFSRLKEKQVSDINEDSVGTIVDLGIDSDNGAIIYCVLKEQDGHALRAVPLGAFVQRDTSKDWRIELERKQIEMFAPFEREKPPQEIDRGWQEYVAVRYGRDALQAPSKQEPGTQEPGKSTVPTAIRKRRAVKKLRERSNQE